jgi:hypothetical protein
MLLEAGVPPAMLDPTAISRDDTEFHQFEAQVASGQLTFAWRIKDPSIQTETFLRDRLDGLVKTEKLSFEGACERLRLQIDGNPMISNDDQAELSSKLNAIVEARGVALSEDLNQMETRLHNLIDNVPSFGQIKRDEIWRLFATGQELDPNGSNPLQTKEDFLVRHGPDSLIRLEQAFAVMVEGHLNNVLITSDHVMQINEMSPNPGFRQGPTVLTTRSTGFDPDFDSLDRLHRENPWFQGMQIIGDRRRHDRSVKEFSFSLPDAPSENLCRQRLDLIMEQYQLGIGMIDDVRDGIRTELYENYEKRIRAQIMKEQQNQLELGRFGHPMSDEEVNDKVNERVGQFRENLDQHVEQEVTRRKQAVIARAVQELYRSQLFAEGTRQWTVSMVMNRMLLDAGLPPAILNEPEQVFARSTGMVDVMINLEGKNVYNKLVPKDEDKRDLILLIEDHDSSIELIEDVGGESVDELSDESSETFLVDDPDFPGAKIAVGRTEYERQQNQVQDDN